MVSRPLQRRYETSSTQDLKSSIPTPRTSPGFDRSDSPQAFHDLRSMIKNHEETFRKQVEHLRSQIAQIMSSNDRLKMQLAELEDQLNCQQNRHDTTDIRLENLQDTSKIDKRVLDIHNQCQTVSTTVQENAVEKIRMLEWQVIGVTAQVDYVSSFTTSVELDVEKKG
jgi:predicted RNase H-like nuclease (RuvC/YqgF family)